VLRNLGVGLAHSLVAYQSTLKGLGKLEADGLRMDRDLAENQAVLAEAIQTVMRRHGVPAAYDRLKEFTRGRRVGAAELREFVAGLPLPPEDAARLASLTPAAYVGMAADLASALPPASDD
jgi:adenylosuccinate lyase